MLVFHAVSPVPTLHRHACLGVYLIHPEREYKKKNMKNKKLEKNWIIKDVIK